MTNDPIPSLEDSEAERIRVAEERLSRCTNPNRNTDGWIPVWSSDWLDRIVQIVLGEPNAKPTDIFRGLWNLLSHTQAPLTEVMTEFQRAIIITTRIRYRTLWTDADFSWVMTSIKKEDCTAAQAYLSLSLLKEEQLATCKEEILGTLKDSEYLEQALHTEGILSLETLPYGNFQIHPIKVQGVVVDGVGHGFDGTWLGIIVHDVRDNQVERRFSTIYPGIRAPAYWKMLIQKYLGDEI